MAAAQAKRKLALDSNFLFDLANEKDFARALLKVLKARGFELRVPPTVVQELVLIASDIREESLKRDSAGRALENMLDWGIAPYDLIAVGHGITEQFANCLIKKGLLPTEEFNDGQIVAETSLGGMTGLITSDRHLLDIEQEDLRAALEEKDLAPIHVCHPKNLLRLLDRMVK